MPQGNDTKWIPVRFNKWKFEYEAYANTIDGTDIIEGRIPFEGLSVRNVYHEDFRVMNDMRTNAIFVYPGDKAKEDGFTKVKKLILGGFDFEQIEVGSPEKGTYNFDVVKFNKSQGSGARTGLSYNYGMFSNSIEGELIVKWKSVDKIFGENSGHLYVTQKIVFTKYSEEPAHEPSGGLMAARVHPLTRVYYYKQLDGYLDRFRVDYRFDFTLDTFANQEIERLGTPPGGYDSVFYSRTQNPAKEAIHAGIFKDRDNTTLYVPAQNAAFDAAEKPIKYEIIGRGLVNGDNPSNKSFGWDNIHVWGGGGNIHASAPGAFHAIHMHWRWGKLIYDYNFLVRVGGGKKVGAPQFEGEGKGGALTDPRFAKQSIKFAIIQNKLMPVYYSDHTGEDFGSVIREYRGSIPNPLKIESNEGNDLVFYYSCLVEQESLHAEKWVGYIFLHGLYFAHENERGVTFSVGSKGKLFRAPSESEIKRKWGRNPGL